MDVDIIYQEKVKNEFEKIGDISQSNNESIQEDRRIDSFSLAIGFKRGYLKLLHYRYKISKFIR